MAATVTLARLVTFSAARSAASGQAGGGTATTFSPATARCSRCRPWRGAGCPGVDAASAICARHPGRVVIVTRASGPDMRRRSAPSASGTAARQFRFVGHARLNTPVISVEPGRRPRRSRPESRAIGAYSCAQIIRFCVASGGSARWRPPRPGQAPAAGAAGGSSPGRTPVPRMW
jgi:hypothetical protein